MKATPEGSNKASKKPTLFIDVNDPRLKKTNAGITYARSNAEINPVNLSAVSLSALSSATLAGNNLNSLNQVTGTDSLLGVIATNNGQFTQSNAPLQVTNLTASYVGDTIVVNFTFDLSDTLNSSFTHILFKVYSSITNTYLPLVSPFSKDLLSTTGSSQTIKLTPYFLSETGVGNTTVFTKIELATFASIYTNGYVESNTFGYTCDLPAPIISASHSTGAYTISVTNLQTLQSYADFGDVIIQEYITDNTLTQVQAADTAGTSTWNQVAPATKITPVNIVALDGAHRWVRGYSESTSGGKSSASTYVDVTPDPVNPTNLTPPTNFTTANASFSSNDIIVTWTMPSQNAGTNVRIKLVPVINGTASSSLYGYFYTPIATGQLSYTIKASNLLGIFGEYYTSYQAHIDALSDQGVPSLTVLDIATFSQTNSLAGFTPTASIINAVSGYGVNFSLGTTGADYGEIYQFYQNPTFLTSVSDPPDYMDADYQSGTGTSTLVVNNLTYEGGSITIPSTTDPTQYFGYQITGTNLPSSENVFVSAISYNSGTQKYSLSLSYYDTSTGALTPYVLSSASGTYHLQCLVYSGIGPASIYNTLYNKPLYVVIVYYTYGGFRTNSSYPTYNYTATPINPAQSLISNSVQIGSGGAIYVGSSATTGSRIVLGPSGNKGPDGTSAYSGIFAFDYGSTSDSAASTAIITNPGASSYTFETTNALIANWAITTNNIQNLGSSGTYVGLSSNPSASYAIWAGAGTSGGDNTSKFTVTPGGAVVARSISIYGNGTDNTTLAIGGSGSSAPFTVDAQGNMKASSATITGDITAQSGNFTGNVNLVGTNGILGAYSSGATQTSGSRVMFRSTGIYAYDASSTSPSTAIFSNALAGGTTFQTWQAIFGKSQSTGWTITGNDTATTISSQKITLSSNTETITVLAADSNQNGVVISGASNVGSGFAIQSGSLSAPNFTVTHGGSLTAVGATITGILKSSVSATGANTSSLPGYYLDNAGGFIVGSPNSYIQYQGSGSINLIGYPASGGYTGTPGSAYSSSGADGAGVRTTAYASGSKIILNNSYNGINIYGMPVQGNYTQYGGGNLYTTVQANENNPSLGLGALGRQRMLVEDPYDGMTRLGMAVYYQDTSYGYHLSLPTSSGGANSGYVGDLWVVF